MPPPTVPFFGLPPLMSLHHSFLRRWYRRGAALLAGATIAQAEIRLAWVDHAFDEDGYYVERSDDGGEWRTIATVPANTERYTDPEVTDPRRHAYRVRAFNRAGVSEPSNATNEAPVVVRSPATVRAMAGETVQFSVEATSRSPMSYQWLRQGVELTDGERHTGTRTATLAIVGVAPADAGPYSVRVLNLLGAVESGPAELLVNPPPHFTTQPVSRTVAPGTLNVALTAAAAGPGPITYQWRKDGRDLPRANRAFLILARVGPADAGRYTVEARNAHGATVSEVAELVVSAP